MCVCDSLWPYGLWPSRLLCPWDSPGKNTRVGCHTLFHGISPTQGSNLCLLGLLLWQCTTPWFQPAKALTSSVQWLSPVQLFAIPWTAAHQASLSIANSWSLLKFMSIESVMPSNHLILCCPLLLSPSIFPSIRVFYNESVLHIKWPKYWSFSFSITLPMNIQDWFPLGWTGWISLLSKGLSRLFSNCWCMAKPIQYCKVISPQLK